MKDIRWKMKSWISEAQSEELRMIRAGFPEQTRGIKDIELLFIWKRIFRLAFALQPPIGDAIEELKGQRWVIQQFEMFEEDLKYLRAEWIPVEDRLPEPEWGKYPDGYPVLTIVKYESGGEDIIVQELTPPKYRGGKYVTDKSGFCSSNCVVTHWMELPAIRPLEKQVS